MIVPLLCPHLQSLRPPFALCDFESCWFSARQALSGLFSAPPCDEPPGLIESFVGTDRRTDSIPPQLESDPLAEIPVADPSAFSTAASAECAPTEAVASGVSDHDEEGWEESGVWYTPHNAAVDGEGESSGSR